jgi:hypothetical protein
MHNVHQRTVLKVISGLLDRSVESADPLWPARGSRAAVESLRAETTIL